jgi:hypothetical protein
MMLRARRTATVSAFVLLLTAGCDNANAPTELLDSVTATYSLEEPDTLVSWQGNQIQAADDDGNVWLAVRDQQNATYASVYKNGALQGTMSIQWDGPEATHVTFTDALSSHWATTTAREIPDVIALSWAAGGECDPNDPECVEPEFQSRECGDGATLAGDCGLQWTALGAAAGSAISYGIMTYASLTVPGGQVFSKRLFLNFSASVAATGAATGALYARMAT